MGQLLETELRGPAQTLARAGRIADEAMQLGGAALQSGIDSNVLLPVESHVGERALHEFANRVTLARGDDVVTRFVLLQHQPHRADVVACVAPVAPRIEIAE